MTLRNVFGLLLTILVVAIAGVATAWAASQTTGTVSACAGTHTISLDGTSIETIAATCTTTTYTVPTTTQTTTVTGPTTTRTVTAPPVTTTATVTASTTTTAPASPWPASYTDGPLGANEVLPKAPGGVLLGLWGGVAGNSAAQQRAFMQQRMTDMGRTPDVIGFACDAACAPGSAMLDTSSTDLSENWIRSLGAIPFVTWDPGSSTDFTGIAAGNYDAAINAAAARFEAFGHPIMLRMFEEFNLRTWNPAQLVAAWQHVVNLFKADGATNVGFVWCPSEYGNSTERAEILQSYPGDSYVDWVSSDGYNDASSDADSQPCVAGWADFAQLFNYTANNANCGTNAPSMERQYGPTKPFFVSETGSKFDPSNAANKAAWFTNIASQAIPAMPYLIGVQFFDQDVNSEEPGNNWRVDSNCQDDGTNCNAGSTDTTTYQGFLTMSHAAAFNVGAAAGG
jgi:Glycosyl hydrolase family 26